jgi:hypothetical protein
MSAVGARSDISRLGKLSLETTFIHTAGPEIRIYITLFSCGSKTQFWALAASKKLSVSFRLLDLGQSTVLLGRVIRSSQGLCYLLRVIVMMEKLAGETEVVGKTCPDATLSTTNHLYYTRIQTGISTGPLWRLRFIDNRHHKSQLRKTLRIIFFLFFFFIWRIRFSGLFPFHN